MSMALGQLSRAASLYSSIRFNVNTRMCEMSGCSPDTGSGAARSRQVCRPLVEEATRGARERLHRPPLPLITPRAPRKKHTEYRKIIYRLLQFEGSDSAYSARSESL